MRIYFTIIFILAIILILTQCKSQKVEYNLPEPMSAETRAAYMERLDKGKILYKEHCASCHGIFTKGKDSIPNFTKDQLINYRSAVLMANDKKNHTAASKMSPQQLDYVISFLALRKHTE